MAKRSVTLRDCRWKVDGTGCSVLSAGDILEGIVSLGWRVDGMGGVSCMNLGCVPARCRIIAYGIFVIARRGTGSRGCE